MSTMKCRQFIASALALFTVGLTATGWAAPATNFAALEVRDRDGVQWAWPVISALDLRATSRGIDIPGRVGDAVFAAAEGRVVMASKLRGMGKLVVIRHDAVHLSAYAHNSRLLVSPGQNVARGQQIAELGQSDTDRPMLSFEIRVNGVPVDPLGFLPERGVRVVEERGSRPSNDSITSAQTQSDQISLQGMTVSAEASAANEVSQADAKIAAYKIGTTTINDFLADGWRASDAVRGKVGIIAARFERGATTEFVLGGCGDLNDPEYAQLLESQLSDFLESFQNVRISGDLLFWPNGIEFHSRSGQTLHCERRFHLTFRDSVLLSSELLEGSR